MKKNAFTLIELIATIALLGMLATIVITVAVKKINETKEKSREMLIESIELAAITYVTENTEELINFQKNDYIYVTLKTLVEKEYFTASLIDQTTKKSLPITDTVYVTRNQNGTITATYDINQRQKAQMILNGAYNEYLKVGSEYIEKGVLATASDGSDISTSITTSGSVDTTKTGTYTITYTYNNQKITRNVIVYQGEGPSETIKPNYAITYIENLLETEASEHGLENPKVTNNGTEYDTGIRYIGSDPNNYVWFNCNPTDKDGREYGNADYIYDETSCEKWRIIGVFDVEGTERVKIINTSSTFKASWDSSADNVNYGSGINQWGESTYLDVNGNETAAEYEGADLMRLLNGYYIETNDEKVTNKSACEYCTNSVQPSCSKTTNCSLLKPLTESALGMIGSAKWYTYATATNTASTAYLQERGITNTLTGKECTADENYCSDQVTRENEWTGKVGLMYLSDMVYANGWLYNGTYNPWSISPRSSSSSAHRVWRAASSSAGDGYACTSLGVWPSVYLNSNIQITGAGENIGASTNPYKLSM